MTGQIVAALAVGALGWWMGRAFTLESVRLDRLMADSLDEVDGLYIDHGRLRDDDESDGGW